MPRYDTGVLTLPTCPLPKHLQLNKLATKFERVKVIEEHPHRVGSLSQASSSLTTPTNGVRKQSFHQHRKGLALAHPCQQREGSVFNARLISDRLRNQTPQCNNSPREELARPRAASAPPYVTKTTAFSPLFINEARSAKVSSVMASIRANVDNAEEALEAQHAPGLPTQGISDVGAVCADDCGSEGGSSRQQSMSHNAETNMHSGAAACIRGHMGTDIIGTSCHSADSNFSPEVMLADDEFNLAPLTEHMMLQPGPRRPPTRVMRAGSDDSSNCDSPTSIVTWRAETPMQAKPVVTPLQAKPTTTQLRIRFVATRQQTKPEMRVAANPPQVKSEVTQSVKAALHAELASTSSHSKPAVSSANARHVEISPPVKPGTRHSAAATRSVSRELTKSLLARRAAARGPSCKLPPWPHRPCHPLVLPRTPADLVNAAQARLSPEDVASAGKEPSSHCGPAPSWAEKVSTGTVRRAAPDRSRLWGRCVTPVGIKERAVHDGGLRNPGNDSMEPLELVGHAKPICEQEEGFHVSYECLRGDAPELCEEERIKSISIDLHEKEGEYGIDVEENDEDMVGGERKTSSIEVQEKEEAPLALIPSNDYGCPLPEDCVDPTSGSTTPVLPVLLRQRPSLTDLVSARVASASADNTPMVSCSSYTPLQLGRDPSPSPNSHASTLHAASILDPDSLFSAMETLRNELPHRRVFRNAAHAGRDRAETA